MVNCSNAIDISLNFFFFFFLATWKMINPIHITKLKLLYDVELTKQIGGYQKAKVMFGNSFCFLFSKTCFGEYKEKTIFLYFWNQKQVWLVEIKNKKNSFLKKKIENTKICCY